MTDHDHIPLGWICPRCGKVWAPTVQSCECAPDSETELDNDPQPGKVYIGFVPAGRILHYVETRTDA